MLQGSATRLLFPDGAVTRSAASAANDIYLDSALPAVLSTSDERAKNMITLGGDDIGRARARGVIMEPLIQGDENDTLDVRVSGINPIKDKNGRIVSWRVETLGELDLVAALGTYTEAECGQIDGAGSLRHCDSVTWTLDTGLADVLDGLYTPAPTVYSPGSNGKGYFIMADAMGYYGLIFEPYTAGVGFNALVRLIT